MPKATFSTGILREIQNCYIDIPGFKRKLLNNLPEISDSKSAHYNAEGIIGRSSPLHTYSFSDTRTISVQFHLFVVILDDFPANRDFLRAIESCTYPRIGDPYLPPVVCKLKCGQLLGDEDLCIVLQNYSVSFPTDVAWDDYYLMPYRFDISTNWWVVYSSPDLPDNTRIINSGR